MRFSINGFVANPITVQNFSFLFDMEVPGNFTMLNLWNLKGPLIRLWVEIWGFQIFPCTYRATVISIQIFTLLRNREALSTIFRTVSGAPGSAPALKLFFLFFWFCDHKPYQPYLEKPGNFPHVLLLF